MFKKLEYTNKQAREKVFFSSKKGLDEHLKSDIVYAIIEDRIFTVHNYGDSYRLEDRYTYDVATLDFNNLVFS